MEFPVRILVVEDSASLLRIYRHVLSQAGHTVLEASTGSAALKIVQRDPPDIMLLDRVLPDIDGSQICAQVKGNPDTAEIYVIMVSGLKTTEDDRVSGLEAGADDYVLKPVSKRELLARVQVAARLRTANLRLRASETQFRTLTENSPDYIARIERDGQIRYLNPAARQLFARDRAPGVDSSGFARHLTTDAQLVEQIRLVFGSGTSGRVKSVLRNGPEVYHFDTRLVPEFAPNGEVNSILAVSRDFTDFVLAEQEVRRLATVIQQSVDAVQISDAQGQIIYANAAFTSLTGVSGKQVLGKELPGMPFTCLGACAHAGDARLLNHLRDEAERWQGMIVIARTDGGAERNLDASIFPIRNLDGEITNYAVLMQDVTERIRAEQEREVIIRVAAALRTALVRREVVDVILDQMMLLMHVVGVAYCRLEPEADAVVAECLRGVDETLSGSRYPLHNSLNGQVAEAKRPLLVHTESLDQSRSLQPPVPPEAKWAAGIPLLVHDRVDGVLWVSTSASISEPMLNLLHSLVDMLANAVERAALYETTRLYAEELEQRVSARTQELARANEQLRELDKLKSKFVSNVSHELRTPIANLKLYLNLLERGNQAKRAQYEAMLRHSADRLGQLVQDILSLSRLEMAQLQPREFLPTDLNAVVAQVVQHHQPQAESAGLALTFAPARDLPLILGDFNQIAQLVTNLVSNALTYTQQGRVDVQTCLDGLPEVQASNPSIREFSAAGDFWDDWTDTFAAGKAAGPCVHLVVRDTGVGIHPDDMPYVFDRFYRGEYLADRDIPGTGLGLAIVKEIVTIHQGTIDLTSEVSKGTTVDVVLPTVRAVG